MKQPYPCVKIDVSKNPSETVAELQLTIKDKELPKHIGTIIMIQSALIYVMNRFKHIQTIELQDETWMV